MTKKVKFKKRYVVGTGCLWMMGYKSSPLTTICLGMTNPINLNPVNLDWPDELLGNDVPQYRLVLERVEKDTKK